MMSDRYNTSLRIICSGGQRFCGRGASGQVMEERGVLGSKITCTCRALEGL